MKPLLLAAEDGAAVRAAAGARVAGAEAVAHYAGEHWQPLMDYLSGKLQHLPEG